MPKYFGLEDSDLPAIAIHEGTNDGKYFFKNAAVKKVEKWAGRFPGVQLQLPACYHYLRKCSLAAFVVVPHEVAIRSYQLTL